MFKKVTFYLFLCFALQYYCPDVKGQQTGDTLITSTQKVKIKSKHKLPKDSTRNPLSQDTNAKKFNPRLATYRSAIIPGWGQAYNKKYWKIPIIYAALGITTATFIYNIKYYRLLKQAYIYRTDSDPANDLQIDPSFIPLSTESIRSYRNEFRQNVDYSVIFFLLFWGLNVVDATVDAHLKSFDVSEDLTLKLKPKYDPLTKTPTLSLVFSFKDKHR
jgi:hypothetical protein